MKIAVLLLHALPMCKDEKCVCEGSLTAVINASTQRDIHTDLCWLYYKALSALLLLQVQTAELYRHAARSYAEAGRAQSGAESLCRGAKAVEDKDPVVSASIVPVSHST